MQIRWRPKLAEAGQVQLGDKSFIRLGGGRSLGLTVTRCWVRGKQSEDKKIGNRLKSHEVQTRHSVGVGQRWTKCYVVLRLQDHVVLRSWKLRTWASPTSLSWNRDPGVISKPRSNSSSSNLLETSSPFIIVFFRYLPNCDVYVYLRKYQSVPSSFSISLHLASPHSWQPADPTLSICILFAQKYYLPRKIICPELLFALKYCLPGNIICPEKFLLRNISCPETFFAQQYHLFRNIICSKILFAQK